MTQDESVWVINHELGLDGAITHKGDQLKCYTRDHADGGVSKTYLDAEKCRVLAAAFGDLAASLDGSPASEKNR